MFFRTQLIGLLFSATLVRAQDTLAPRPVRDSAYAARNLFRERRQKALQGGSLGLAGLSGAIFTAINHQPGFSGGILLVTGFSQCSMCGSSGATAKAGKSQLLRATKKVGRFRRMFDND